MPRARVLLLASVLTAAMLPALAQPAFAASTFTVNSTADTSDGACNATPDCTLREAILAANATAALDTITFSLGSGTPVINVGSGGLGALPTITQPLMIRGATGGATRTVLDGTSAGSSANGLDVQAGGSTIAKLVVRNFSGGAGIFLDGAGSSIVRGCYLGTDPTGSSAAGDHFGIRVGQASNVTIGGTTAAERNVVSGNLVGIFLFDTVTSSVVSGNFVGTDSSGTAAIPNTTGLEVFSAIGNTIGGTDPGAGNLISGNTNAGLSFTDSFSLTTTVNNVVQGNLIGTDVTGAAKLANGTGISMDGVPNSSTIGGTTPAARNVISGNTGDGISLLVQPPEDGDWVVEGNYIGTDVTGTARLANGGSGVRIGGSKHNDVGMLAPGSGNVISGNHDAGVLIDNPYASTPDTTLNRIRGNLIGTNAAGTAAIPNGYGVHITGQRANTIGGTNAAARNVISGNAVGIGLDGNAIDNSILGNAIGVDPSGKKLPNESDGIGITDGSFNTIGGTAPGAGNVIANNGPSIVGGDGVFVQAGRGNTISGNSIYGNSLLGIDLGGEGSVTANDTDDADTGPNDLANFPAVKSAVSNGIAIHVAGTLGAQPRTAYSIELFSSPTCDPSGNGEGRTFLGTSSTSTDHLGNGSFDVVLSKSVAAGQRVTATATDPNGSTSEFSTCRTVAAGSP
ncbi:MAG TPA: CSLREA domain-containing protein [Actinomycetota bacterium]